MSEQLFQVTPAQRLAKLLTLLESAGGSPGKARKLLCVAILAADSGVVTGITDAVCDHLRQRIANEDDKP